MKKFLINGGAPLYGEVKVSGAKNAALPILFATLLTDGVSRIDRLPDIGDVRRALSILAAYGAKITRTGDSVCIDTRALLEGEAEESDIVAIRASSYLIGGCLARFGRVKIRSYGGCNFADRPIDMHIAAAKALGASERDGTLYAPGLRGGEISFLKTSVGATVNALLLAATAKGNTRISGAAREPHIDALIDFLSSAGAQIARRENTITVRGAGGLLHGGEARVIPDAIEAGTYLLCAPLTGGKIAVSPVVPSHLCAFLPKLRAAGVSIDVDGERVFAQGAARRAVSIVASPHPGFPTDLQPLFSVLLSTVGGRIRDRVFPERVGYLASLSSFGIRSEIQENNGVSALIYPSKIKNTSVCAPDLRGGAACVLAALAAVGESEVSHVERILRGYDGMTQKLSTLGADIRLSDDST